MNLEAIENGAVSRPRAREIGIAPGIYSPGVHNSITDLAGVLVGHVTLIQSNDIRTGATAILPHTGNLFQEKVPAGLAVANGYGKLMGATQIVELGEIETPIVLTNTLAIPAAAQAILNWTLTYPGNEQVISVNPLVGETNDGWLNDIRKQSLTPEIIIQAITSASSPQFAEGTVGAGTGTVCFGWKGGIGTSSRKLPKSIGGHTLGVLVQSNFGGRLRIEGVPIGMHITPPSSKNEPERSESGSIIIVLGTDAPLSSHNLERLARRTFAGLARTGAAMNNSSGDYAIAFSTAESVRRTVSKRSRVSKLSELPNDALNPLFQAAIEATEEAIYNSLFKATSLDGYRGRTALELPLDSLTAILRDNNPD